MPCNGDKDVMQWHANFWVAFQRTLLCEYSERPSALLSRLRVLPRMANDVNSFAL